jgi:hypothetical protein
MTRDYMAALLVLTGDSDREKARTKLLESISKEALIGVINSCISLGISEGTLTKIASLALEDHATQSLSPIIAQLPGTTTSEGK